MGPAPGAPGLAPTWCSSAKEIVGCSLGAARLWFTVGGGIINEVYYPRVDLPQKKLATKGHNVMALVLGTGRPARVDDYTKATGGEHVAPANPNLSPPHGQSSGRAAVRKPPPLPSRERRKRALGA